MMPTASILDPVHSTLSPQIWQKPADPAPILKPQHAHWITKHVYDVLERNGYQKPQDWLTLVLTGSLTTYQYGDDSDCDVSLFINSNVFPEWSRAEMIGLMIDNTDGVLLPGTSYPMQCFVVGKKFKPTDLYKPGLRSGYDIGKHHWIVPPERSRSHNVEQQENGDYMTALEAADKMERLLRYEPDKAVQYWHQIHKRRQHDQAVGKGDYSQSNIIYKFLSKRGLFPAISEASGEYIASTTDFALQGKTANLGNIAMRAFESIRQNDGVTIGLNGVEPHQGYAFSVAKNAETIVPEAQLTPQAVEQFLASHAAALNTPNHFLGAWVHEGNVYLDISQVEPNLQRAMQLAAQAQQLAIFNLATFEEIPVTAPREPASQSMGITNEQITEAPGQEDERLRGERQPENVVGSTQRHLWHLQDPRLAGGDDHRSQSAPEQRWTPFVREHSAIA